MSRGLLRAWAAVIACVLAVACLAQTPNANILRMNGGASKPVYACDYTKGAFCGGEAFSVAGNRMMTDGTTNCGGAGCLTWGPNNLLTYSNTFSNATWTAYNTTVSTTSSTTDPFGGNNAWHFSETNTANSYHQIVNNFSISTGNKSSYTYYVKSAERSTGTILLSDTTNDFIFCQFDTSAGTIGAVQTAGSGWSGYGCDIVPRTNGWYEVNIYGVFTASGTMMAWMEITNAGVRQYTGTTGFGLYVYNSVVSLITYEIAPRSSDLALVPTTSAQAFGPRFDYTGGVAHGLLYEPVSATNLVPHSQDFTSGGGWTSASITVTANALIGPDGTMSGTQLTSLGGIQTQTYRAVTLTSSQYSWEIYAHAGTANFLTLNAYDGANNYVSFNLANGSVGSLPPGVTANSTYIGNGWYKFSVTKTITTTSNYYVVNLSDTSVSGATLPSSTSGVYAYVFGAQIESSSPSSYAPTLASSITRAAETLTTQGTLASAAAIGPVAMSVTSEATGITTCTQSVAGAFAFPANDNWIRSVKAYPPGTPLAKAAC